MVDITKTEKGGYSMKCPKCGSETWDNREKNVERIAQGLKPTPEFKCKAECGWLQWPDKTAKAQVKAEMAEDQAYINSLSQTAPAPEKTSAPDWDAKERRMVRMNTLRHATELIADESMSIAEKIKATKDLAKDFEAYVYQG